MNKRAGGQMTFDQACETCANCGKGILSTEPAHVWSDMIVCGNCFNYLDIQRKDPGARENLWPWVWGVLLCSPFYVFLIRMMMGPGDPVRAIALGMFGAFGAIGMFYLPLFVLIFIGKWYGPRKANRRPRRRIGSSTALVFAVIFFVNCPLLFYPQAVETVVFLGSILAAVWCACWDEE